MAVVARPAPPRTPPPRAVVRFETPTFDDIRMFVFLWGMSGVGKTTMAATAPGVKGFLLFDNQGISSIAYRNDFRVLNLTAVTPNSVFFEFNSVDPFGIKAFIKANPEMETLVLDNLTILSDLALQYAVTLQSNSTYEVPGMHGYGTRNSVMRRVVQSIMQICGEFNLNLVVIAHEDNTFAQEGAPSQVTVSLSKALANDVGLRFNEVWHMSDTGSERLIYVRPHANYTPMKSRMFSTKASNRFVWSYDVETETGEGIVDWFNQWKENGGKKIPLPSRTKK